MGDAGSLKILAFVSAAVGLFFFWADDNGVVGCVTELLIDGIDPVVTVEDREGRGKMLLW